MTASSPAFFMRPSNRFRNVLVLAGACGINLILVQLRPILNFWMDQECQRVIALFIITEAAISKKKTKCSWAHDLFQERRWWRFSTSACALIGMNHFKNSEPIGLLGVGLSVSTLSYHDIRSGVMSPEFGYPTQGFNTASTIKAMNEVSRIGLLVLTAVLSRNNNESRYSAKEASTYARVDGLSYSYHLCLYFILYFTREAGFRARHVTSSKFC